MANQFIIVGADGITCEHTPINTIVGSVAENPIIIVNPNYHRHVEMPDKLNIMKNAVLFNEQDNINKLITTTLQQKQFSRNYHKMYSECFYSPDKSGTIDPLQFIKDLLK